MKKRNDLLWSISLLVIGIATIILSGSNIIGIELPDIIVRIIGVIDLLFLPVLAYTTVKKMNWSTMMKTEMTPTSPSPIYWRQVHPTFSGQISMNLKKPAPLRLQFRRPITGKR